MRAVLFGYREYGVLGLEALRRHGIEVVRVVTHHDDPTENRFWPALDRRAAELGIDVSYFEKEWSPELLAQLRGAAADIPFSCYFREIIPDSVLSLFRRPGYNLHGSLLPKLRGRAPLNWALVLGERATGMTLHELVKRVDAGGIVGQETVEIDPTDTAFALNQRMMSAAVRLLDCAVPEIAAGTAVARPQNLEQGSYVGRRRPEDGRIDWAQPAERIYDLVRAVTHPYPGAFTVAAERKLTVWWGVPAALEHRAAPGELLSIDRDGLLVAAGRDALRVIWVQLEDEPQQPACALSHRREATIGSRWGGAHS